MSETEKIEENHKRLWNKNIPKKMKNKMVQCLKIQEANNKKYLNEIKEVWRLKIWITHQVAHG